MAKKVASTNSGRRVWNENSPGYRDPIWRKRTGFTVNTEDRDFSENPDGTLNSIPASAINWAIQRTRKGNINPGDATTLPFYSYVSNFMERNPNQTVYRTPKHGDDIYHSEPVKKDLSNIRFGDSFSTVNPLGDQGRAMFDNKIQPTPFLRRVNLRNPKQAANIFATYDYLGSSLQDWESAIRGNNFLAGFYDLDTENSLPRDARIIRKCLEQANGDTKTAYYNALNSGISEWGYKALKSIIGYQEDSNIPNERRGAIWEADYDRFWNAYEKALELYDRDQNRGTSPYSVYNLTDEEDMAELVPNKLYQRSAEANKYSRGGRLRTAPKTLRDRYGHRLGRAEGLGNDDYDVYF